MRLSLYRNNAQAFATYPIELNFTSRTSARIRGGRAGHAVVAWHDGAVLHVGRIAPSATVVSELPGIAEPAPRNKDTIELTVDQNGDGFVFFRRSDGIFAVRGWQGGAWVGPSVPLPDTSFIYDASEPVALPGGSALVAVANGRGYRVTRAGGTTVVTPEALPAMSTKSARFVATDDGEVTMVGERSTSTSGVFELLAARKPVSGTWSSAVVLSQIVTPNSVPYVAMIEPSGTVTVAYNPNANSIVHRRLAKEGSPGSPGSPGPATWTAPATVPLGGLTPGRGAQVAVDPVNGDVLVGFTALLANGNSSFFHSRCQ